jgi:hypothetical protein
MSRHVNSRLGLSIWPSVKQRAYSTHCNHVSSAIQHLPRPSISHNAVGTQPFFRTSRVLHTSHHHSREDKSWNLHNGSRDLFGLQPLSRRRTTWTLTEWRRCNSTKSSEATTKSQPNGAVPRAELSPHFRPQHDHGKSSNEPPPLPPSSGRPLLDRLPQLSQIHRPTKEELLAAATGFWSRLKVRFKWATIRSGRPFNMDDISGFFSWILVGHVVWILVGTTTFFSLAILTVNTVFAQGMKLSLYSLPRH